MRLKTCPICGKTVKVHGPEDWHPTFYDPDSGGDPYSIECECGLSFCVNSYDFEETAKAWNKRVSVSQEVLDQVRWEQDVAIKQLSEIGKSLGERMDDIKRRKT